MFSIITPWAQDYFSFMLFVELNTEILLAHTSSVSEGILTSPSGIEAVLFPKYLKIRSYLL
jgi:hypothetical protein